MSIWNNTMAGLESSSERFANSFQASHEAVAEGTAGSAPTISQENQVASVNYRPGDVAKPASTTGEISTSIPIMTPEGTMGFQNWAVFGYDAEGRTSSNPKEDDYKHEPQMQNSYWGAGNEPDYTYKKGENRQKTNSDQKG